MNYKIKELELGLGILYFKRGRLMEKEIKKEKYNNTISVREKICFDNDKYLKIEKEKILERKKLFPGKLYIEVGGKLLEDNHAARVLPGFKKDNKIRIFETLKEDIEVIITIAANNIVDLRKIQDKGITYADETIYIAKVLEEKGIKISGIVISRYYEDILIDNYINKLKILGYNVYKHYNIEGYPLDIENVVSENGLRKK